MFYFAEHPGVTNGGTANHDAIYAVTVLIFKRFLRTVNIAVTKNGYMYAGVIFYFGYQCPVGFALIHLRPCAAMNGQCFYTHIL